MAGGVRITMHGPLFDGRAQKALRDYVDDVEAQVADEGVDLVKKYLHEFLENPTGRYESTIHAASYGSYYEVTDGGKVVYGPWLAGTGSRNFPRTRFRGYKHWLLAWMELDKKAGRMAERIFQPYLRRMK